MGWTNLPVPLKPGHPVDYWVQDYSIEQQINDAIQERARSFACNAKYPAPNQIWNSGVIDAVTDNNNGTLTIAMSNINWPSGSACSTPRWIGYTCTIPGQSTCYIPTHYDLILVGDETDPLTVVRGQIQSQTYTAPTYDGDGNLLTAGFGTLTIPLGSIPDTLVAKFLPSLNSLVGKNWYIIKAGGLWVTDRRRLKPNDHIYWEDTLLSGWIDPKTLIGQLHEVDNSVIRSPYDTDVANPPVAWQKDQFAKQECLVYHAVNQVEAIPFTNASGAGHFTFTLESTTTGAITFNSTPATLIANINAALDLAFGASNLVCSGTSLDSLIITASGGSYAARQLTSNFTSAITLTSGTFTINGSSSAGTSTTLTLGSPRRLHRYPILGNAAQYLWFGKVPNPIPTSPPAGSISFSGVFCIVDAGARAMPGRDTQIDSPQFWYRGVKTGYYTHLEDDTQGQVQKPVPSTPWQELNSDDDCQDFQHDAFDVDAQIEIDNICECARAGDFVAPHFHKTWRGKQLAVLGLCNGFLDTANTFGDGSIVRQFVPATVLAENGINASGGTLSVDPVTHIGNIGTAGAPYLPIGIYYAIEDPHQAIVASGFTTLQADGSIGTFDNSFDGYNVVISFGLTRYIRRRFPYLYPISRLVPDVILDDSGRESLADPAAITASGAIATPTGVTLAQSTTGGTLAWGTHVAYRVSALNASGGTLASTEVTAVLGPPTTDGLTTYSVTVNWPAVNGASNYNVYGRTAGGELFIGNTSSLSFTDDGTVTPSGALPASNTTHNDCAGIGTWHHRDRSYNYRGRTGFGWAKEGATPFVPGDYARYVGDNAGDPFDGRGGVTQILDIQSSAWDKFYRGCYAKALQKQRDDSRLGSISFGTNSTLTDATKNWWTDGLSTGQMRMQGAIATGGGADNFQDSTNTSGQRSCWWQPGRYVGTVNKIAATPYAWFIAEISKGGLQPGHTQSADGTVTYTPPDTTHSGTITAGSPPTIASTDPSTPATTGLAQVFVIKGNNFQPGCTIDLFDSDNALTYSSVPTTSIAPGVVVLSFAFPLTAGTNWTVRATNPGGLASAAFSFTTQKMFRVPIVYSSGGTIHFTPVPGLTVAAGDGMIIREPHSELNKWQCRSVTITKPDKSTFTLPILYSDNNTLYFAPQTFTFQRNWKYQINEYPTNVTMLFATAPPKDATPYVQIDTHQFWIEPRGADPRDATTPFLADLSANAETVVKDYGCNMADDDLTAYIPNEIVTILNSLFMTPDTPALRSYQDGVTPELCYGSMAIDSEPGNSFPPDCSATQTEAYREACITYMAQPGNADCDGVSHYWTPTDTLTVPIGVYTRTNFFADILYIGAFPGFTGNLGAQAQSAYAYVTAGCDDLTCDVDFYAKSVIPGLDSDVDPEPGKYPLADSSDFPYPDSYKKYTYNAFNTPLKWRTWTKWSSKAGASGQVVVSDRLNAVAQPPIPAYAWPVDEGPDSETESNTSEGFVVTGYLAAKKWHYKYL